MTCRIPFFKIAAKPDVLPSIAGAPPVCRIPRFVFQWKLSLAKTLFTILKTHILSGFQNRLRKCKFFFDNDSAHTVDED